VALRIINIAASYSEEHGFNLDSEFGYHIWGLHGFPSSFHQNSTTVPYNRPRKFPFKLYPILLSESSTIRCYIICKDEKASLKNQAVKILSRVRGSVTNNNGFWVGWLDLLPPYLQLQSMSAKNSLYSLLEYECLLFYCDSLGSNLRIGQFFSFRCPLVNTPQPNQLSCTAFWILLRLNYKQTLESESESEPYVTTDGQSASLSWDTTPIWGLRPDFYYCQTVVGLLVWGVLSDERTGLSFTIAAVHRQGSDSWVPVPWDPLPYFTVSASRLPFSSPPTTRRDTVEVFDSASTRE
jgi:hypothetical protein